MSSDGAHAHYSTLRSEQLGKKRFAHVDGAKEISTEHSLADIHMALYAGRHTADNTGERETVWVGCACVPIPKFEEEVQPSPIQTLDHNFVA